MNFTLEFKNGTFENCLGLMKRGEADLMTSLLRRLASPDASGLLHHVVNSPFLNQAKKIHGCDFEILKNRVRFRVSHHSQQPS